MIFDRYASDPLQTPSPHHRQRPRSRSLRAEVGEVVEDVQTGFVGAIVRVEKAGGVHVVVLEDRHGKTRSFPLGPGFWVDGEPVTLVPPASTLGDAHLAPHGRTAGGRVLTASGSIAVQGQRARVARASRIWVEGRHDAELVERVWGDDLRVEGVVVELLEGVDNLAAVLADFRPGPGRRAGVLVDHLVPGSKETRLVEEALRSVKGASSVLVLGHPYVDVWQAVKPARVGLDRWPEVPRGTDIKVGTLRELGWPHADQADIASGWKRILGSVRDYRDLEPALLGRMEELIDFVTAQS